MKSSQLAAIINRLETMTNSGEVEVRRFEKEGVEKCIVRYNDATENFELIETGIEEVYQFDDIDLVSIEVYELLQD